MADNRKRQPTIIDSSKDGKWTSADFGKLNINDGDLHAVFEEPAQSILGAAQSDPAELDEKDDVGVSEDEKVLHMDMPFTLSLASSLVGQARSLSVTSHFEGGMGVPGHATRPTDNIVVNTLPAESCFLSGREAEALQAIKKLRKELVTSNMTGSNVMNFAKQLAASSKPAHISAVILFPIACDIFLANISSPNDAVQKMYECIWEMHDSVNALIREGNKGREIAVKHGIYFIKQMYQNMRSIKGADSKEKTLNQASSLLLIGSNYLNADKFKKSKKSQRKGIKLLEKKFLGNQSNYRSYGYLLHEIGVSSLCLDRFSEAEKYFLEALTALRKAKDFSSETEKKVEIKKANRHLDKTRSMTRKKRKKRPKAQTLCGFT